MQLKHSWTSQLLKSTSKRPLTQSLCSFLSPLGRNPQRPYIFISKQPLEHIRQHRRVSRSGTSSITPKRSYKKTKLSTRFQKFLKERWRKPTIWEALLTIAGVAVIGIIWDHYTPPYLSKGEILSPRIFTPFTIISKEQISPTSFILTLRPSHLMIHNLPIEDPYDSYFSKGIWSVEFKQPEIQIVRSYTPLPPTSTTRPGDLHFLIRKEKGGEVSNYLVRLSIGETIEMRGPHVQVEFKEMPSQVLFLAGGTGIAPAMQVAVRLLEKQDEGVEKPKIDILWANRRREDCLKGSVVDELEVLKKKHGGYLNVELFVDGENRFINKERLSSVAMYGGWFNKGPPRMIFVSGPEGFVQWLVGQTRVRWKDGQMLDSRGVGGLIGGLDLCDWKVCKL